MTREEAIEMLKKDKEQRGKCFISEAVDMAIKALEQEVVVTISEIPKDYKYDTETEDFLVYRNMYTGDEIHIERPTPVYRLEQEPCEDAISRAELLKAIDTWDRFGVDDTNSLFRLDNLSLPHYVPYLHYDDVVKCIKGMPSVTPKQKMGRWTKKENEMCFTCNQCWTTNASGVKYNFCPNCGAKMTESEDKKIE